MLSWLQNYFIPHQGNNHHPHFLRKEATLVLLSVVLVCEIFFLIQALAVYPYFTFFASILPSVLVQETNSYRSEGNLPPLATNPTLMQAAQKKADDMAARGYFSHQDPDGHAPWYWFDQGGYYYRYAGENLAVDFSDAKDVAQAWMNSPTHRANILNGTYAEIGIGVAQGTYEGHQTTFVVQFFGAPAGASSAVARATGVASVPQTVVANPLAVAVVLPAPSVPATTSREVLGVTEEEYAAPAALPQAPPVAPHVVAVPHVSFWARIVASPRWLTSLILLTLATLVYLALLLKLFIKMHIQHPAFLMNGTLLLFVIGSVLVVNKLIVLGHARIF